MLVSRNIAGLHLEV